MFDGKYVQKNSDDDLSKAIHILKTFTEQNNNTLPLHISNLEVKNGSIVAASTSFFKNCISALFSEVALKTNVEKRSYVQDAVTRAIDTIKGNYVVLEKLSQGSAADQKFVSSARAIIAQFNNTILRHQSKKKTDWPSKVSKFLLRQSGLILELKLNPIELPLSHGYFSKKPSDNEHKITQTFFAQVSTQTEQLNDLDIRIQDAFILKISSLLLEKGYFESIAEALSAVRGGLRELPLQKKFDKTTDSLTLIQTIFPWPGVQIIVQGSFLKSSPLAGTFKIESSHCEQRGFPDPMQYTGISLTDPLIAPCPHRVEQLDLLTNLYKKKNEAIKALQPKEKWAKKTRSLIKLTKDVFHHHKIEFLDLHKAFCLKIAESAPQSIVPSNIKEIIENFFLALRKEKYPFELLVQGYRHISTSMITQPYHQLQIEWADPQATHYATLRNTPSNNRYTMMLEIFDKHSNNGLEALKLYYKNENILFLDFFLSMGSLLSHPSKFIILQHLSENIRFPPPMLSDYEQKIQAWAYKQQMEFFHDLEEETSFQIIEQRLRSRLLSDIQLFENTPLEQMEETYPVPNLLEGYFNSRFLQISNVQRKVIK
jgi:hypothetical protein